MSEGVIRVWRAEEVPDVVARPMRTVEGPTALPVRYPDPVEGGRVRPPTAAELEALQLAIETEARESGHSEGLAQGRAEGHTEGVRQGYEEGYRAGLAAGQETGEAAAREAGEAEWTPRIARLQGMLDLLAQPLQAVDEQVQEELLHLAVVLAQQLYRRALHLDHAAVVGVVREAMALLPSAALEPQVHLHPEDIEIVAPHLKPAEQRRWALIPDPGLERGGCVVESANTRIDATVQARLTALAAGMLVGQRAEDASEAAGGGEVPAP